MPRSFTVRTNCEYSLSVEAENEEDAIEKAYEEEPDVANWNKAWASTEAEEE